MLDGFQWVTVCHWESFKTSYSLNGSIASEEKGRTGVSHPHYIPSFFNWDVHGIFQQYQQHSEHLEFVVENIKVMAQQRCSILRPVIQTYCSCRVFSKGVSEAGNTWEAESCVSSQFRPHEVYTPRRHRSNQVMQVQQIPKTTRSTPYLSKEKHSSLF